MRTRNEWPAWAATAVGLLGLVGLANAQSMAPGTLALVPGNGREEQTSGPVGVSTTRPMERGVGALEARSGFADLPMVRQLLLVRNGPSDSVLSIDLFDEQGRILEHMDWTSDGASAKAISLEALATGRYAVRVSGERTSETVRFRKN